MAFGYTRVPPDMQLVQTLAFFWDKLRSDEIIARYITSPDQIINTTLARPAIDVLPKNNKLYQLHQNKMPYLALWRGLTMRHPNYRIGYPANVGKLGVQWLIPIPQGGDAPIDGMHYDGLTWGANLAHLVWARMQYYMEDDVYHNELITTAKLEQLDGDEYEIVILEDMNIIGFEGTFNFEHSHPMYDVPEGIDLQLVAMTIKLYDGSVPSDLGLEVDANVEV